MRPSRSRSIAVVASSTSALLLMLAPAFGQTSSEVEALQRQIEMLQQQLDDLRRQVEGRAAPPEETARGSERPPGGDAEVDATTAAAESSPEQAPPSRTGPTTGTDQVRLEISGQINRGVLLTDDGDRNDVFFVDNDNSSSRVRFVGKADLTDDVTIGSVIEVQIESNSTADVSQIEERNAGIDGFSQRKIEIIFGSDTYGQLSLGQGSTASDGTSEVDLSGTGVVGYSSVSDMAGGILFRDGGDLSAIAVGDAFSNFDGLGRDDRLRYDSPEIAGFIASASVIADERYDAALRYSRAFGGTEVQAAVAVADANDAFEQYAGSVSALTGGVSATFAAGLRDNDGRDEGTYLYGKVGYEFSAVALGRTAIAIDYYPGSDIGADGDDGRSFGAFVVQDLDAAATELYAGYRLYDLHRDDTDLDVINAVLTGARIKF